MKVLSLALCVAVLGLIAAGLWPAAAPVIVEQSPNRLNYITGDREAESFLAQGLIAVNSQSTPGGANAIDRAQLLDALEQSNRKGPVYLSIALYSGGPWEAFSSTEFLRRELDRQAGVLSPRLAEVAANAAPQDRLTVQLLQSLRLPLERFRTDPESDGDASRIAGLFTRGDDCTLLCLEAAVAEAPRDPSTLHALALRVDGQRRADVLAAWQSADPGNAAPWYLESISHHAAGDLPAAIAALTAGGAQPHCEFPTIELPTQFQARFATDPALGRASGQAVKPHALANLIHLRDEGSHSPNPAAQLHQLALTLTEAAADSKQRPAAPRIAAVLRRVGAQLLTARRPTATQVRHGLAILQLGAGLESAADGRPALSDYDFHLQRSTRELSAGLSRWNDRARELLQDRDAILTGAIDLRGEEHAAMHKLVTAPPLQPVLAAHPDQRR